MGTSSKGAELFALSHFPRFFLNCTLLVLNFKIIMYLFIFGCAGSSLLQVFSRCGGQGLLSSCNMQASHSNGLTCCGALALAARASVVVACRL